MYSICTGFLTTLLILQDDLLNDVVNETKYIIHAKPRYHMWQCNALIKHVVMWTGITDVCLSLMVCNSVIPPRCIVTSRLLEFSART